MERRTLSTFLSPRQRRGLVGGSRVVPRRACRQEPSATHGDWARLVCLHCLAVAENLQVVHALAHLLVVRSPENWLATCETILADGLPVLQVSRLKVVKRSSVQLPVVEYC